MSSAPATQSQNGSPRRAGGGFDGQCFVPNPLTNPPVVPCKRLDDDVQFISSKPVKRRKISEAKFQPLPRLTPRSTPDPQLQSHQHTHMPLELGIQHVTDHGIHLEQCPFPGGNAEMEETLDLSHNRRVSTGMVGLPSYFHDIETAYALRGVSLPVLENFVLNQPPGKPRPVSSPALSPKQLPQTVSPALLSASASARQAENCRLGLHGQPGTNTCFSSNGPVNEHNTAEAPLVQVAPGSPMVLGSPLAPVASHARVQTVPMNNSPTSMQPPDAQFEPCQTSIVLTEGVTNIRPQPTYQPTSQQTTSPTTAARSGPKSHCQICAQLVAQRAAVARAQILPIPMINPQIPMHNHSMLPSMSSPMPCASTYDSQSPLPFMAMSPPNVQSFGPGFSPVMMPMHMHGFGNMNQQNSMPLSQQPTPVQTTSSTPTPPKTPTKPGETSPASPMTPTPQLSTPSSPFKPPSTLIQPTYRKPSPNLIVDVAETCQETFPFGEVAKRHNTTVEKVTDVFAAIIQVPLLRCPTDRRRPGRLATTRVKEYTKAKKDIQEEGGSSTTSGSKHKIVVRPLDIAQRLGPMNVPEELSVFRTAVD